MIQPCSKCKNYDISIHEEPCRKCQQAFRRGEGKPNFIASITNADRIRAMSDEEMAEWVSAITLNEFGDKKDWIKWMKRETKDD